MTTLAMYSLRTEGLDGWRITKFVDGEVEASYAVGFDSCECPAGHRHTCRHRQMLPQMLAHNIADTHWFYLHDRAGAIVDFNGTSKTLLDQLAASAPDLVTSAVMAEEVDLSDPVPKADEDGIEIEEDEDGDMDELAVPEGQHVEAAGDDGMCKTADEAAAAMAECDYWQGRKSLSELTITGNSTPSPSEAKPWRRI